MMNPLLWLGAIASLVVGGVAGYQIGTDDTNTESMMGLGRDRERAGEQLERSYEVVDASDYVSMRPGIDELPAEAVSAAEQQDLEYMREEEKLARDVYQTLGEQWQLPIFFNIAQSEQTHTEAIRDLLVKYDIADPVTDDTIGVFENPELQQLYADLVAQGSGSVSDALRVGATIEDLDIKDLEDALGRTDNEDIAMVYENLQKGSRNHLRSFVAQLNGVGETYEPVYISMEMYNEIISTDHERGNDSGMMGGHSETNGTQQSNSRGWGGGKMGGGMGQNR